MTGKCYIFISGNCLTNLLGIDWIGKFGLWESPLNTPKIEAQTWPETNKPRVQVHIGYVGPINGQYFFVGGRFIL